jgi:hypothetical protein
MPNLFIIGAPKCGTSSLFDWLLGHPDICGSRVKEPFFLINPDHPLARRPSLSKDGLAGYANFFEYEDGKKKVRMEATTHYLFDEFARDAIAGMDKVSVIVILREPAKRIYSSFQYTMNNLARLSPSLTFDRYISLVESGEALAPKWCDHTASAFVLERDLKYSRYANYLEPWLNAMGGERIKVLIMEDMIRHPDNTVKEVLNWLGLDPSLMGALDSKGRNRTQQVRMPALQSLIRDLNRYIRPPEPLRGMMKSLYGMLQFRNKTVIPPEDIKVLEQLRLRYIDDNSRLSRLTGLDLSVWSSQVRPGSAST